MATEWNLTGSNYIISGTNASVTEVKGYASNGAFETGNNMGYCRKSNVYNALVIRLTITPTVKTKTVTFSFAHTDNTNGYSSATGTFYVKASTSPSAWPSHTSNNGTSFDLTAEGTTPLTVSLSEATSSSFYVYLWAYYDPSGTYDSRYVHVNKLSGLSCTKSGPTIYVKTGSSTWSEAKAIYAKTGASAWSEISNLYVKTAASTWTEAD